MLVSSTIASTSSIPDLNERETDRDREHMEFIKLLILTSRKIRPGY